MPLNFIISALIRRFRAKFQIPASLRLGSAGVQVLGLDPELV